MNRTGYFLSCILIASSLGASAPAKAGPCDFQAGAHKVQVKDYKAVGDGKTDDGPAIRAALKAAIEGPKPGYLEFESGKTYRITTFEETYAMRVINAQNITLQGNGAELLLLPPNKVLRIAESSDVNVCGITIDYSPLPFTQGMVVSTNPKTGTFDIEIEEGFDVPEVDSDSVSDNSDVWEFAMPYKQANKFEKRVNIKVVHAATGKRRIRITPSDQKQWKRMVPNQTHLVMAMPGKGQTGNFAFQIFNNNRVHMESIRMYAVPQYTYRVAENQGSVSFAKMEQRIRPGSNRVMTGWRDVFHVKDNHAPVFWDGCYIERAFDDAFNLSAMYQIVEKKTGPSGWQLQHTGKGDAPIYNIGDRLQAIDLYPARRILGEAKITAVKQKGGVTEVTLSHDLPLKDILSNCRGKDEACGSRLVNLDAANEGSIIRNCTVIGSLRIRSKARLESIKVDGFLQIASEPVKVGPLVAGVVVKDSELRGNIRVGADSVSKIRWDRGERWAKNIRFVNNHIESEFKADGADIDLINNDIAWPKNRKFKFENCGPVTISGLTANGKAISNPLSRISMDKNMTASDIQAK